jgi:hypothetical protein
MMREIMRIAVVAAIAGPAIAAEPLPDADYCSLRSADPARCVIRDGGLRSAIPLLPNADYCSLRDADPRYCVAGAGAPVQRIPASPADTVEPPLAAIVLPADRPLPSAAPPGTVTLLPATGSIPGNTALPGSSSFGGAADTPSAMVPPSPSIFRRQPGASALAPVDTSPPSAIRTPSDRALPSASRPSMITTLPATGSMPGNTTLPGSSSFGGAADMPAALVPPSPSVFQRQPGTSAFPPAAVPPAVVLPGASSFGGSADTPAALVPPNAQGASFAVPGTGQRSAARQRSRAR